MSHNPLVYRWVPFNPNPDNQNFPVNSKKLWRKFPVSLVLNFSPWYYFLELSARYLYFIIFMEKIFYLSCMKLHAESKIRLI